MSRDVVNNQSIHIRAYVTRPTQRVKSRVVLQFY